MEIPPAGNDSIAIFLACDERFFPYTITTIASFMENANPADRYDVIVLTCNGPIPEAWTQTAHEWFGKNYPSSLLRFYDGDQLLEAAGKDKFYATKHYSVATYLRFFAPSIFKQYDRILYLDSDMIILADIAELFRSGLKGCILGACHDIHWEAGHRENEDPKVAAYISEILGLTPEDGYFNAGMALFDLNVMREHDIQTRLVQALDYINESNLPDQDILNHICKGRVQFLEPGWNVFAWMIDPVPGTTYAYSSAGTKQFCMSVKNSVKLIHFTEIKPWSANYSGSLDCYYWHYSSYTPFHDTVLLRWKRETGAAHSLVSMAKLAFHICRCGLGTVTGSEKKRFKDARRLYEYKRRLFARARRMVQAVPPAVLPEKA